MSNLSWLWADLAEDASANQDVVAFARALVAALPPDMDPPDVEYGFGEQAITMYWDLPRLGSVVVAAAEGGAKDFMDVTIHAEGGAVRLAGTSVAVARQRVVAAWENQ